MPSSPDPVFFAARNDCSLIFARVAGSGRSLIVEELREAPVVEKSSVSEALQAVFPTGSGKLAAAAIRSTELLHLANADEARRLTTLEAVQKFARESAEFATLKPGFFAVASAREGTGAPWLLAATSATAHEQVLASLAELQLAPARTAAASLHTSRALCATLKARGADTSVLCLDFGAVASHALLLNRSGVEAAGSTTVSMDSIAEAVQSELGLKFKGSASKLFFNELYDFSEAGPKIAARLAPMIKTAITALGGAAPAQLHCAGLPAKQQWLATLLAAELGLSPYAPDLKAWCSSLGITFGNPMIEAALSPAWLGFLHFVSVQSGSADGTVWSSNWTSFDATLPVAPAPIPTPVAPKSPAPAVATVAPEKPVPKPVPVAPKPAPVPVAKSAAPAQVKAPSSVSYPPKPAAAPPKPAAVPPKAVTPVKAASVAPTAKPKPVPASAKVPTAIHVAAMQRDRPEKKSRKGLFVGIAAGVALLIGGFLFMQWKQAEDERVAKATQAQRVLAEKQAQEEAEKVRVAAAKKARDEEDARKKQELEVTQKLAAAEAARKQADVEARAQETARLANARGTVIIRTVPAGATVTLGNLPPRPSPATFTEMKLGKYPVSIALLHHESSTLDVDVNENVTTEPAVVRLTRITGTMEVASDPAGASYEVRPANLLLVPPEARLTGRTPATLSDLAAGEYTVRITQDGWPEHTENITVGRNASAKVSWAFQNGIVQILSIPDGATVTRNGSRLGVTPLTMTDQPPGEVRYDLRLPEHEPASVSGRVENGRTLSLSVPLLSFERIANISELDKTPEIVPQSQSQPNVPAAIAEKGGRVEIELTVSRTGAVKDLVVLQSTNPALDSYCLASAAKLRFKPGTINGTPMNVRVRIPYVFSAQ